MAGRNKCELIAARTRAEPVAETTEMVRGGRRTKYRGDKPYDQDFKRSRLRDLNGTW